MTQAAAIMVLALAGVHVQLESGSQITWNAQLALNEIAVLAPKDRLFPVYDKLQSPHGAWCMD